MQGALLPNPSAGYRLINPICVTRHDPECPQRVQDDRDVDQLLQQRALHRGQIAEGGGDHAQDPETNPCHDAFEGDAAGSLRDFDTRQKAIQVIDQQHDIRRFRRSGRPTRAHGNTDIRRRQRGGIVYAVTHHHDRAILALRQDQQDLLGLLLRR